MEEAIIASLLPFKNENIPRKRDLIRNHAEKFNHLIHHCTRLFRINRKLITAIVSSRFSLRSRFKPIQPLNYFLLFLFSPWKLFIFA